MSEDIKALLEKLHQEGIKAAEIKAADIEARAKQAAEKIIAQARAEAERVLGESKELIGKDKQAKQALLAQAGRDLILGLRREINAVLDKIISAEVREALPAEALDKIIAEVIKKEHPAHKGEVVINLSSADRARLEEGFLSHLKEELKQGIVLRPSEELAGGFTISFDAGKSQFDFSDQALAEYIGSFIKPKLKQLLDEAI